MKNLGLLCILFTSVAILFTGCSKGKSDDAQILRLSTEGQIVYTDAVEYSFDIVSGGGNYEVELAKNSPHDIGGKVSLTGNRVKVDLVSDATNVIVTDQYSQSIGLTIWSSHKSLQATTHSISVSYGTYIQRSIDWGNGNYSLLKQFGDAANISFDGNSFIIQSVHPGNATFIVRDQRGTTNAMVVTVGNGWDLNEKELTVTALGGYYYTFPLKYGAGGWKITSCPAVLNNAWTVIMPKDQHREHDMLQIMAPEADFEPLLLKLTDKAGNTATITILSK